MCLFLPSLCTAAMKRSSCSAWMGSGRVVFLSGHPSADSWCLQLNWQQVDCSLCDIQAIHILIGIEILQLHNTVLIHVVNIQYIQKIPCSTNNSEKKPNLVHKMLMLNLFEVRIIGEGTHTHTRTFHINKEGRLPRVSPYEVQLHVNLIKKYLMRMKVPLKQPYSFLSCWRHSTLTVHIWWAWCMFWLWNPWTPHFERYRKNFHLNATLKT